MSDNLSKEAVRNYLFTNTVLPMYHSLSFYYSFIITSLSFPCSISLLKVGCSISLSLTHGTLLPMRHRFLTSGDMPCLWENTYLPYISLPHSNTSYSERRFILSSSSLHPFLELFCSDINLISLARAFTHSLAQTSDTHSLISRL